MLRKIRGRSVTKSNTSAIHFETQRDNKTRWVKQAQLEGQCLTDWITDTLEQRVYDYNTRGMRDRVGTSSPIGGCSMGRQSSKNTPEPAEVRAIRERIQQRESMGITSAQDRCAEMLHTSRRAWQQWERGDRKMHPAFWELISTKCAPTF